MRIPTATTSMDRPVNLFRATTTCNTFYIFLSAAKAALLPFLTLFFRLIGLNAMETGIIMAAKTLTGFVWAPLWARCAVAYNKRRMVLIFSLLMMGLMYLSFTAVYYKVGNLQTCQPVQNHGQPSGNGSSLAGSIDHPINNILNNGTANSVEEPNAADHVGKPGTASEVGSSNGKKTGSVSGTGNQQNMSKQTEFMTGISSSSESPVENIASTSASTHSPLHGGPVPPSRQPFTANGLSSSGTAADQKQSHSSDVDLEKLEQLVKANAGISVTDNVANGVTAAQLFGLIKHDGNFTEADIQKAMDMVTSKSGNSPSGTEHPNSRHARTLNITFLNNFKDTVGVLTSTLKEKQLLLFLVVLLIIIFGEFFSSPVEKIADDAWFDFLERIDDMEKYGRQRYWGSLTFALVPIIVTCIVDYTPCRMVLNLHHFLLHFLVFGVFILFTLFTAFYFPMPPPLKQKYSSKVGKGLRVICCDGRGFLFVITLLVGGSVYASFNNYLFWYLQDLGGHEVTMGLCVSIGAFAETPMLVFSNKLVRKLGNGGVVSLSLFVLAVRLLYYGFLWTPWAVLPAEVTNAFTHTALWYAVLSYDEFNVGSAMDRSIRSILSSLYFGLGFSIGSFVSGVVYHVYGAPVLFWGCSVLSGLWCLVYSLIQFCLPKKERVKYIKLLRKEDDDSSDADDDWLEMALKDQ